MHYDENGTDLWGDTPMRVNIDESFFYDERIKYLSKLSGEDLVLTRGRLLGLYVACYRDVTEFMEPERIDIATEWTGETSFATYLLKAKLAEEIEGEAKLRIKGVTERIQYLRDASANGKKSAEARRQKYGTAQPNAERPSNDLRRGLERPSKVPEPPPPSPSLFKKEEEEERKKPKLELVTSSSSLWENEFVQDLVRDIPLRAQKAWVKIHFDGDIAACGVALGKAAAFLITKPETAHRIDFNKAVWINSWLANEKQRGGPVTPGNLPVANGAAPKKPIVLTKEQSEALEKLNLAAKEEAAAAGR